MNILLLNWFLKSNGVLFLYRVLFLYGVLVFRVLHSYDGCYFIGGVTFIWACYFHMGCYFLGCYIHVMGATLSEV